jgi:hypothetical protein
LTAPVSDGDLLALAVMLRRAGQKRLTQREIRQAFTEACPALAAEPDARARLQALLLALAARGTIRLPDTKRWDDSQTPPLPSSLELLRDPAAGPTEAAAGWHPALAFAAIERQPAVRDALLQLNRWLQSAPSMTPPVPLRERSLHVFGDPQVLDAFQSPDGSFGGLFGGRLPLAAIGVIETPLPLAHEMQPAALGAPLLVLENLHSYASVARWNTETRALSAVVYGGGPAVLAASAALRALAERSRASALFYAGDLDPDGLAILARLRQQLPALQPHLNLYRWLLRHGHRAPMRSAPAGDMALTNWPADLAQAIGALFAGGQRIAQENFGTRELHGWCRARHAS